MDSGVLDRKAEAANNCPRLQALINLMSAAAVVGDCQKTVRKQCSTLARRVKLLAPLLEEVKEIHGEVILKEAETCFRLLEKALTDAAELMKLCRDGSKIYLVVGRDDMEKKFLAVTKELEQALDALPYKLLETSDEVREQIELVHAQLKRAKGRADMYDSGLHKDLTLVLLNDSDQDACKAALERVAEKLQLKTLSEIKQEERALCEAITKEGEGLVKGKAEDMSLLLGRLKGLVITELSEASLGNEDDISAEKEATNEANIVIPEDFKCPISLELMKDPVIVATGQTYDQGSIQMWLEAGNRTCPKTQQVLPHVTLTPNYALRSLIFQWCEVHGVELPKKEGDSSKSSPVATLVSDLSPDEIRNIENLLLKLTREQPVEVQRAAAGEIRLLAKRNVENRIGIAAAGAVPLLVGLLSVTDPRTQEHAVTSLLNLSIHEGNKGVIVTAGAIDPIVEVLRSGSMEARENAAATLFSLSVVDDYKVSIGVSGAIPALVGLLQEGSLRGKKDAATALFNLSIYQGNKARAVRAGVVPPLMKLLADPTAEMVDESLAILAVLATHLEGRAAIRQVWEVPVFIDLIQAGTPRHKENAAAVVFALCQNDRALTLDLRQRPLVQGLLFDLARNGTNRARRKATAILELFQQFGPASDAALLL